MSKTPKNKIVVRVIEDEALILDLMEEVLAGLDVPRKIRRGGFRNVHRRSAFNMQFFMQPVIVLVTRALSFTTWRLSSLPNSRAT